MSNAIFDLLDQPDTLIAVVGATDNPGKFGHTIYLDLKRKGYRPIPVNPGRHTVDGDPAYPNLSALPKKPDIVNLVVPPAAALAVAQECLDLGITNLWLQPGADGPEVLAFLERHRINYLAGVCIMIETRRPHVDPSNHWQRRRRANAIFQ